MTDGFPKFTPVADHAVLVHLGDVISDTLTNRVHQLDRALSKNPPHGLCEIVPAFVNLLIEFDPLETDHVEIEQAARLAIQAPDTDVPSGTLHEVLVCYDEDLAPDLCDVSLAINLPVDAVIAQHLSATYRVGMYGFAPGYAYLSGVPQSLQIPRKPAAMRDIPAGSVLIAGAQCLVSTLKMPTGWSIIGRSPTNILRDDPQRPFLFDVGDEVTFKRISRSQFNALEKAKS